MKMRLTNALFSASLAVTLLAPLAACTSAPPPEIVAAEADRKGDVLVTRRGDVRIHTYVSPADGFLVNTQIVETLRSVVIFDAQLREAYAGEVAAYVARLNKPVSRIVVSHGHRDHWSGLGVLHQRFPDAPIYAHAKVRAGVASSLQAAAASGQAAASAPVPAPTDDLADGDMTIDGVRFIVRSTPDAESDYQSYVLMPDQGVLMAFDTVFPANTHEFTVAAHFDHWIETLKAYKPLERQGYQVILTGHGRPTDFSAIPGNIRYLETAREAFAKANTAQDYAGRMKAAFPDYAEPGWIEFSSGLLYRGVVR